MPYVHVINPAVMALGVNGWIVQGGFLNPDYSVNTLVKNYHWGYLRVGLQ